MKVILNIIMLIAIGFLAYLLYNTIREPIKFKAEKTKRENVVIQKLKTIRQVQEMHFDITGEYADSWDELSTTMREGQFRIIKVIGDEDATDGGQVYYDTQYVDAIDTIRALNIDLDELKYVPYSDGTTFDIAADTITYQNTKTAVVEVGVRRRVFMGQFADPAYSRYDDRYDPNSFIKFGDLNKPNISGNWE